MHTIYKVMTVNRSTLETRQYACTFIYSIICVDKRYAARLYMWDIRVPY